MNARAVLAAVNRSQAIIEFDLTGRILHANENFLQAVGYTLAEIVGKNHRIFVAPEEAQSAAYATFWANLAKGNFDRSQYRRIAKGGREIWIEASYNPVFRGGKPYKVVKFATEITGLKLKALEDEGKLAALGRAQAVIEFTPEGDILTANANFLSTLGYSLAEIVGRHHSMFCTRDYAASPEYARFWERLAEGQFVSDQFTRIAKDGSSVHIQASYNPILDADGKVFKVVKFATDVTERVRAISEIGAGLGRLAECNIRVTIDDAFVREFEPLRRDFNNSIAAFQDTLSLVLDQTYVQNRSGQDMRKAAEELSERTRKQAVALEETAAALTQATIAVRSSTERTRETRQLVQDARISASSSAQVVNDTVSAMQRIEAASSEIGQIIGVIDEIAFQTNLLALNAGVEAARAGDAGRGFAVVAQEVRELAQRSAKAAREIKTLITNSGTEVQDGVRLVGETGRALQEIGSFVQKIDENVDAIATSAAEQAAGLEEISAAVSDVDRITQENAAMVERTTATSQTLAEGAVKLSDLVNRFQLNRRARRRDGSEIWTPEERAARLGTMRKAS